MSHIKRKSTQISKDTEDKSYQNQKNPKKCDLFGWARSVYQIGKSVVITSIVVSLSTVVTKVASGIINCQPLESNVPLPLFSPIEVFGHKTKENLDVVVGLIAQSKKTIERHLPLSGITVGNLSKGDLFTALFSKVGVEELFMLAVREGLLRQLPKAVFKKISPRMAEAVDHPITKVSRVAIAALFFSALHTGNWTSNYPYPNIWGLRMYDIFVSAVMYNGLNEFADNKLLGFMSSMAMHFEENYSVCHSFKLYEGVKDMCKSYRPSVLD